MQLTALESLGNRIVALASPPSILNLIELMSSQEDRGEFMRLVKEFTPEVEAEVRHTYSVAGKMQVFAQAFERNYFRLWPQFADGEAEEYYDLIKWIPVQCFSYSWDDYHDFATDYYRPGFRVAAFLVEGPWQGDDGERIAIGDSLMAEEGVSGDVLGRIENGIERKELHKLLDGTRFESLAFYADMLHYETGNSLFDNAPEQVWEGGEPWTREIVEAIKADYQEAEKKENQLEKLYKWLEEDLNGNTTVLINFIDERRQALGMPAEEREKFNVQALDPVFHPSKPNQQWLSNLISNLGVGGRWVAPMGFTFIKTAPGCMRLADFVDNPQVRDTIERTVACATATGIRVDLSILGERR